MFLRDGFADHWLCRRVEPGRRNSSVPERKAFSKPFKELLAIFLTTKCNFRQIFGYIPQPCETSRPLTRPCRRFELHSRDIYMFSSKITELSIHAIRNDKTTPPLLSELAASSSNTIIINTITITTLPHQYLPIFTTNSITSISSQPSTPTNLSLLPSLPPINTHKHPLASA